MGVLIKGLHIDEIFIDTDPEENQPELARNLEGTQQEPLQEEPAQEEPKPEPKAEPTKPAPKKNAPKKSKPIDKGKIGALYKAGWSAAKIADEMKLSLSTVYRIIKEIQEAK